VNRGTWLIDQLPLSMLDDDFMVRFLGIFQELADTLIVHSDNVEHVVDVAVAPDSMVRYLGSWIGAEGLDQSLPDPLQRQIVRRFGQMLPWRGTTQGLKQVLELVTGHPPVVEDSGGVFAEGEAPDNPAHVRIQVASTGWTTEEDLLEMIQAQLPAFVTFELSVGGTRVWPIDGPSVATSTSAVAPAAPESTEAA
jgi:phage tail-like protein